VADSESDMAGHTLSVQTEPPAYSERPKSTRTSAGIVKVETVQCLLFYHYHPHSEGGIVFSSACLSVCLSICLLSVNTVTSEPLEISSQNFQGIILWLKGQTSL